MIPEDQIEKVIGQLTANGYPFPDPVIASEIVYWIASQDIQFARALRYYKDGDKSSREIFKHIEARSKGKVIETKILHNKESYFLGCTV